ncbi:hypothetical protein CCP3SC5AM1_730002 [Gammaproteobacteria bacterium]
MDYLHLPLSELQAEKAFVGQSCTSLQNSHDTLLFRLVKLGLMSFTSQSHSIIP